MEKNIKDYLHLYLGCELIMMSMGEEVVFKTVNVGVHGGCFATGTLLDGKTVNSYGSMDGAKLLLRPLSDMTEEEGLELAGIIYKGIFGECEITFGQSVLGGYDEKGFKLHCDEFDDVIGLTVSVDRGVELSANSNQLLVKQFDCFQWLLSKRFDLFGLIESGLAIAKTKQLAK